jgi:ppGpp synthetase/RelA/SpoT-type nucleotidyltranferase
MTWNGEYRWASGDEPPTASQAKKAGERIRRAVEKGEDPLAADLHLLDVFRAWHGQIHNALQLRLGAAIAQVSTTRPAQGITIAGRPLKTREAIIAKLVREKSRLNRIQDIAGARVVVPDLATQEAVLQLVLAEFDDCGAAVAKDSRKDADELGYRGLHVVVQISGRFAEIQIRTMLQGLWAQVVEKFDETGGSDLKHGSGPDEALKWLRAFSDRLQRVEGGEKADMTTLAESFIAIAFVGWTKKKP